jgi:hypothetical protein
MRKYKTITNNPDRVGKDTKQIIFFEELKGESLENVVEYWLMMNKSGAITINAELLPHISRGDNSDKLLLVKEINNKIKEIETLINKLEETEIDRLERGKDKEE